MALPPPDPADTIAVTGASSGIGAAIAFELASRGYGLTLVARREDRLRELADRIGTEHGVVVDLVACDLVDDDERRELIEALGAPGDRRLVGVCNDAGLGSVGSIVELDPDHEVRIVRLNALALHELTVRLVGGLVEQGAGAMLNVASVNGFQPLPGTATYSATKAFVISFSEALHAELVGTGVSCTVLSPGPTRTPIWERSSAGDIEGAGPGFLWQEAPDVARVAVDAMVAGRRTVVPGLTNKLAALGGRYAPRSLLLPVVRALGSGRLVNRAGG
jgi:short-subunit dehydrogenase